MKQTAMQQFIEWIIEESRVVPVQAEECYDKAKELLEIEREQIVRARQDGLDNGFSNGSWDSNLYYKETYE
jgi:hypothetical protein